LACASCTPDDHTREIQPTTPILYQATLQPADGQTAPLLSDQIVDLQKIGLRNPNTSASGHYNTNGGHTITLSVMENNGGVHGQGHITGPIYVEVDLDMACVAVDGNRATVGGEITDLDLGDNPLGLPIDIGWFFYLAVEDNGEGANAPADRHHSFVYFGMPGFGVFCDVLNPNNTLLWPEGLWFEVVGPQGEIQVK
ncbi:MAG: hypothetical protein R3330_06795, partial [Saprospiraceae bacterium]|nr:hypothetical protein [Saprospiraceae bacterium]